MRGESSSAPRKVERATFLEEPDEDALDLGACFSLLPLEIPTGGFVPSIASSARRFAAGKMPPPAYAIVRLSKWKRPA